MERYLQMTSVLMALKAGFFLDVEPRREIWLIPERIGRNNPQSSEIVANFSGEWGEGGVTHQEIPSAITPGGSGYKRGVLFA
jgi:hypothetical protein